MTAKDKQTLQEIGIMLGLLLFIGLAVPVIGLLYMRYLALIDVLLGK